MFVSLLAPILKQEETTHFSDQLYPTKSFENFGASVSDNLSPFHQFYRLMEENSMCEKEEIMHDFSFGGDSNDPQNPELIVDWQLPFPHNLFMRIGNSDYD